MTIVLSLTVFTLSFLFKEQMIGFLNTKVIVPIWVFPFTSGLSIGLIFFIRWLLLFRNKRLKAIRTLVKPGMRFGIMNGPCNVVALEWSWMDPRILLAQALEGHTIRVHYTAIIIYA